MKTKSIVILTCFSFILLIATTTYADTYKYNLADHPDGSAQDPLYGLRLDGLIGGNANDIYTFSFDRSRAGVQMFLDYDTDLNTVHLYGTAYGGEDVGNAWASNNQGLVEIDFTYTMNVNASGSRSDLNITVASDHPSNTGTITLLSGFELPGNTILSLWDNGMGAPSFYFNNTDDQRYPNAPLDVFVGWGWVDHTTQGVHLNYSDWLFTATPVPLPGSFLFLLSGSIGFLGLIRKRV